MRRARARPCTDSAADAIELLGVHEHLLQTMWRPRPCSRIQEEDEREDYEAENDGPSDASNEMTAALILAGALNQRGMESLSLYLRQSRGAVCVRLTWY